MKYKVKKAQIKKKKKQGFLTLLQEGNRIQIDGARASDPNPEVPCPSPVLREGSRWEAPAPSGEEGEEMAKGAGCAWPSGVPLRAVV